MRANVNSGSPGSGGAIFSAGETGKSLSVRLSKGAGPGENSNQDAADDEFEAGIFLFDMQAGVYLEQIKYSRRMIGSPRSIHKCAAVLPIAAWFCAGNAGVSPNAAYFLP